MPLENNPIARLVLANRKPWRLVPTSVIISFIYAQEYSKRASDSAKRNAAQETAVTWQVFAALHEAEFGNIHQAKQDNAAMPPARNRDAQIDTALVLALVGDTAPARKLAGKLGVGLR